TSCRAGFDRDSNNEAPTQFRSAVRPKQPSPAHSCAIAPERRQVCSHRRPQLERSSGGTTRISGAVTSTVTVVPGLNATPCARGDAARTESEISLMCAGVVPQQPPINFAPDWMNRFANFDMYSGEHM